jgi:hypothetical protein
MTKFQLTISPSYVPTWGAYEAVREIIQNALDARDAGYPMNILHTGNSLVVRSEGVVLDRAVWLIGNTTKEGTDARGHYGEGLKLGALALVRTGRKLDIVNGSEHWVCSLEDSDAFPGQQVLTVSTHETPSEASGDPFVMVSIECTASEWAEYRQSFLDLRPKTTTIITTDGDILLDESEKGRIYVGGILVECKGELQAGYNFNPSQVRTDRDRRMANTFDLGFHLGGAWIDALGQGHIEPAHFLSRLMVDSLEATSIGDRYCCSGQRERVAAAWQELYGPETVPVATLGEAAEAGHLGVTGRIVNKAVCAFFSGHERLCLRQLRQLRRNDVVRTYRSDELLGEERRNFSMAAALIDRVAPSVDLAPVTPRTTVVDFKSDDILGTHSTEDGCPCPQIRVSRQVLTCFQSTIRVLVHEAAHDKGGDGDVAHERAEGALFAAVINHLLFEAKPAQQPELVQSR